MSASRLRACLIVALSLGLAWALRGHFGHEWGASWAGAIGAAAVIMVARRPDWTRNLAVLVAPAAIGWGAGGMMSYGIIVGYGRSADFLNAAYGLEMLAVVGGLYGFLGGGLFGAALESSDERRVDWARLMAEMVTGGWLAWALLIYQFEWFMTPPRSELWAGCLGAALAMAWYFHREGFGSALRVAGFAALGAGFGFGLGNFFQVLGEISGLSFNWWNVMEFSLGFCGGIGMAWGVFDSDWPEARERSKSASGLALGFVVVGIPVINLLMQVTPTKMVEVTTALAASSPASLAVWQVGLAWLLVALFAGFVMVRRPAASFFFFGFLGLFLLTSYVKKGIFAGAPVPSNYALYPIIVGVIGLLWLRSPDPPELGATSSKTARTWVLRSVVCIALVAVLALIASMAHGELPGAHSRF